MNDPTPLHIVLLQPEIPHNTGAIGRLCVGLDCDLAHPIYDRYRDSLLRIPMPGPHARSLTLANAVSVAVYEAYRQLSVLGTPAANR